MKNILLLAALSTVAVSAHTAKPNQESLAVPFCAETRSQFAGNETKMNNLKYAQAAATNYYSYLEGALRKLLEETPDSSVCSRILVIGKNDAYPGLTKLKYFIRFEVSSGSKLVAAIPILMVNTSEQGHMNPSEKQWMALDTGKVREIMSALVAKNAPKNELEGAPDINGPDFTAYIHAQPIGRAMVAPEDTVVMSLGDTAAGSIYLLTGFQEVRGMYESQITQKALLFLKDRSGKLRVSDDLNAYRDIMSALGEARKPRPSATDKADQIRATLDGTRQTKMLN